MSLPEVREKLLAKWQNSECQHCVNGDEGLYLVSGKPCLMKKRVVLAGGFCLERPNAMIKKKDLKKGKVTT